MPPACTVLLVPASVSPFDAMNAMGISFPVDALSVQWPTRHVDNGLALRVSLCTEALKRRPHSFKLYRTEALPTLPGWSPATFITVPLALPLPHVYTVELRVRSDGMRTGDPLMDYSRYHSLSCERQDTVLIVSLNRPEALNAINAELHTDLSHVFADIALDQETNVVVLTGH